MGLGPPRENFSWGAKLPPVPLALGGAAPVPNFAHVRLQVDGVVQREGPGCAPRGAGSSVVMPSEHGHGWMLQESASKLGMAALEGTRHL